MSNPAGGIPRRAEIATQPASQKQVAAKSTEGGLGKFLVELLQSVISRAASALSLTSSVDSTMIMEREVKKEDPEFSKPKQTVSAPQGSRTSTVSQQDFDASEAVFRAGFAAAMETQDMGVILNFAINESKNPNDPVRRLLGLFELSRLVTEAKMNEANKNPVIACFSRQLLSHPEVMGAIGLRTTDAHPLVRTNALAIIDEFAELDAQIAFTTGLNYAQSTQDIQEVIQFLINESREGDPLRRRLSLAEIDTLLQNAIAQRSNENPDLAEYVSQILNHPNLLAVLREKANDSDTKVREHAKTILAELAKHDIK